VYRLELRFTNEKELELYRITFKVGKELRVSASGKTGASQHTEYTFQWTRGMQGLVILLLATAAAKGEELVVLQGQRGSVAYALYYGLSRRDRTRWLLDVFGQSPSGASLAERIINRSFSGGQTGLAFVSIRPERLPFDAISVVVGSSTISGREELDGFAERLLSQYGNGASLQCHEGHLASSRLEATRDGIHRGRLPPNSELSYAEEVEVIASALWDVEQALSVARWEQAPLTVPLIAVLESRLPSLAARYATRFIPDSYPPDSEIVVERSSHDSYLDFTFKIPGISSSSNLVTSEERSGQFDGVQIHGPTCLKSIAHKCARAIHLYLLEGERALRRAVCATVRTLNPEVVSHLYDLLRRYLSVTGVEESVLDQFSLFAHVGGQARYVLDGVRYKRIQDAFLDSSAASWMDSEEPLSRYVATEAWYGTSVLPSADTMSFTDAILPKRHWTGTPDTWKRPIPGFGASEIAVYGTARACAEPILLRCCEEVFSCCAVYKGEVSEAFTGKFLALPPSFQHLLENKVKDLTSLWAVQHP